MKYERLTKKGGLDFSDKSLCLADEWGYSHIYNRLAELEDKIEQGKMIELPCKVGDWIWVVCGTISEYQICFQKGLMNVCEFLNQMGYLYSSGVKYKCHCQKY